MPEDLKLSQIGSSQLPPPLRGLHSPGVRKHCQIIFACYFRKSSILLILIERESVCVLLLDGKGNAVFVTTISSSTRALVVLVVISIDCNVSDWLQ